MRATFSLGAQAKRTGPRFVNDQNLPVVTSAGALVYPNKTPAYTLVDLDARLSLEFLGLNENTFFQLNVSNLFDKRYYEQIGFYSQGWYGEPRNLRLSVRATF